MRAPWIVAAMAIALVVMAFVLSVAPPAESTLFARLASREITHLVAHSILYGSLAVALASWWFPREALGATRRARGVRALAAAALFGLIAGAQELTQALCRARLPAGEELFDLTVDVGGASLGLIAWAHFDARRRRPVAKALGVVLHPVIVGPVGAFALAWASLRDARAALAWTLAAVLAAAPVAAVWLVGMRRGWFSDHDLSVREERPAFLLSALAAAGLAALGAQLAHAPPVVRVSTLAGLVATAFVTALTAAGLKVSGHVAVPVGVLALLAGSSQRGLWPFAVAALAVSWARVREGRHTPREVIVGWGVAGASGLVARWGF
jgi:hypothetical protein